MKPKYLSFCGINSFSKRAEIDFDRLLSGGIFGIFGDTGSGKTTILDSMIFALYGRVERLRGASAGEIINYNCDKADVRFDFETETAEGRKVYRVEREIKRKNSVQSLTLSEIDGERVRVLCEGVKQANAKIQEIVGLSFEDFKKCIALPQGEFAQFVKAERADRLKLISRLFGLEKYGDQLNAKIRDKLISVRSERDQKDGELRAYADLDASYLDNLKKERDELIRQKGICDAEYERLKAEYDKLKAEYARYASYREYTEKLNALLKKETEIEELRALIRILPELKELRELSQRNERRTEEAAKLEKQQKEASAQKSLAEKGLAQAAEEHDRSDFTAKAEEISARLKALAYAKDDIAKLSEMNGQRDRLKKRYAEERDSLSEAKKHLEICLNKEKSLRDKISSDGDDLQSFLSAGLESGLLTAEYRSAKEYFSARKIDLHARFEKDGELFQAVDAEIDDRIAHYDGLLQARKEGELDSLFDAYRAGQKRKNELNAALNQAVEDKSRAENSVYAAEESLKRTAEEGQKLKESIRDTEQKIKTLFGLNDVKEFQSLESKLLREKSEIVSRQKESERRMEDYREKIRASELSEGKAQASLERLYREAEADSAKRGALLKRTGYENAEQAADAMRRISDEQGAMQTVEEYDRSVVTLRAGIEVLLKGGEIIEIAEEEFAVTSERFKILTEKKQSVSEQAAVYDQKLSEADRRFAQKKILLKERERLQARADLVEKLQKLIRGNAFMEFIASEYLSEISLAATQTLLRLTGGRYFIRYEQGFFVGDNLCGGELRSVNTLSGGETFLVSLSLALALSSAIYAKSLKPIEFFFLDEGFGTLDEKLIETVMDSLEKLKNSRFSIGLISHVEELKHRIGNKITVTGAAENGSSHIQINY